jgi:hypothetical protein
MDSAKVWDQAAVQHLIATNDAALAKALWNIYQRQTASEKSAENTQCRNKVGFNSHDAAFLSSVAAKLPRWNFHMTGPQIRRVRPMMKKYWRQLLDEIEAKGGVVVKTPNRSKANKPENEKAISCETAPTFNRETANPLYGAFAL